LAVARSLNLARDEVEELAVPAYGLNEVGRRVVAFGPAATAVVEVSGGRAVVSWSNADGRAVKAPPAAVRTDHAEELTELKASVKDLDRMLSAQADRLDRQFLAQRVWAFGTWRERYLDHPLLGTLARRLIWLVDGRPAGFAGGGLRDVGEDYGGDDTTGSGTYFRVVTDQVRFHRYVDNPVDDPVDDPVPLADVPPLVFSEVMRDIDLFVGVASVGNDPTWQDGGPRGRFRDYWAGYSFGELGATAQTRRDLLERLVPRLAIADRATVSGRFLEVRGTLRTYRIHLGSGNILMSPNDQYLCIVPKQASDPTGPVFLPFEGDRVLALILSKAILLANDHTITDQTILRQLR
jgi:hypothetical protein